MYMIHSEGIEFGVLRLTDKASIPASLENRDWIAFQEWLAEDEANEPIAYDVEIYLAPYEE